jgi:DNA-binding NarL/FixJ family response regulator
MTTPTQRRQDSSDRAIRVLLVDDHPALRAGLRSLLSGESGIAVQGDVGSGEDGYAWYRAHRPDVVVMDLTMPGFGGIECLRRILQFDPGARVLVYTVHTADAMLDRVLALGGLGYVTKGSDVDVLVRGIREVARGRGFVSPDMVPAMVRKHASDERALPEQLGDRGFQIFLLIAQGHAVAECARLLNLSEKTVRNHLTQIKSRLDVADTAGLTRVAIRAGLVEP